MHRLRQVAHEEVYGLTTNSGQGARGGPTRSRTNSPRRPNPSTSGISPQSKLKPELPRTEQDKADERDVLELIDLPISNRRASPRPSLSRLDSSDPPESINVPPDIAREETIQIETPARRLSKRARLWRIFTRILFFSWSNVLLIMVPVAIGCKTGGLDPIAIFVTSAVAIIPLAALLGYGTEELAKRFGPATGALLNVTFGNATELIVFIIGVVNGELDVVQAAIIGSVLGNLLLILGMAFFLGGLRYKEQYYNNVVTQTTGCCLLLALTSLSIPTAFHASFTSSLKADDQVLKLSYATSIVLLIIYGVYLCFQLKTHAYLYKATVTQDVETGTINTIASPHVTQTASVLSSTAEEDEEPEIPLIASLILLLVSTALVAIIAEFLVTSIGDVVARTSLSEQFVGLIILPIVGNAAEHITAVTVAWKNKMDLSIGIALGSSLQIVLLVAPVTVLIAWCVGQPLTLFFSLFETLSVFATVLIVTYLVIDGRSNYLEGTLLMATYILIAIASILYPSRGEEV